MAEKLPCRDCIDFYINGRTNKGCYWKCHKLKASLNRIENRYISTRPGYTHMRPLPVNTHGGEAAK